MNNAKEIAEKILNCKTYDIPDIQELARAYLELEKELTFRKDAEIPVYKEEITKLNGEIVQLKVNCDCEYKKAVDYFNKGLALESEITKLKAENERLNKYVISGYETVHKESLEEITRLIEENESIRTQLLAQCRMSHELADEKEKLKEELNLGKSSLRCGQCGNIGLFHNGVVMVDEITKLKAENEELKFYKEQYQSIAGKANLKHLVESNEALRAENENLREALAQETFESEKLKDKVERRRKYIKELKACINMLTPKARPVYLNNLSASIHQTNVEAGWWTNLETGEPLERNVGELLCLVHSEVSEALEAYRKDLMDDKLPHRKGFEVELVDALIRIFDIAGKFKLDLDGALEDKLEYNAKRSDHKLENRQGKNGKKF